MAKKEISFRQKLDQLFESLSPSIGGSTVFPDPTHLDPKSLAKTQDDRIENEFSDEGAKKRRAVLDPSHTFVPTDMFGTRPDSGMPASVGVIGDTPPRSDSFIPGRSEMISPSINYNSGVFDSSGKSEDDEDAALLTRNLDYLVCVKCKNKPCSCKSMPTDESGKSTFGGYDSRLDPKASRNMWWHKLNKIQEKKEKMNMDAASQEFLKLYSLLLEARRNAATERRILNSGDVESAYNYAVESAYNYAKDVIKGRWPEAEDIIKKDVEYACLYARDVIKGRWPEAEIFIKKDADCAYWACEYAKDVIKGRWPEAEIFIKKDADCAYWYARNIIKGRWPEAEKYIKKDPYCAWSYACDVIRGRWPEAEDTIKKNARSAYHYAKYVIEGRWPEAEEYIKQDSYCWNNLYKKKLCKACNAEGVIDLGIGGAAEECTECMGTGFKKRKRK